MDVNEHERLSKFTLRHKLKIGTNAVLHFTLKQNNYIPQIDHQFFGVDIRLIADIFFFFLYLSLKKICFLLPFLKLFLL